MNPLQTLDELDLPWEDKIAYLAFHLSKIGESEFDVRHRFVGLWYVREIRLPAEVYFIGRTHIHGHILKLIEGSATVKAEKWQKTFKAPDVMHTVPGFQMVCFTLEPVICEAWHFNPDECQNIPQLEAEHYGSPEAVLRRGQVVDYQLKELQWQAQSQPQLLPS